MNKGVKSALVRQLRAGLAQCFPEGRKVLKEYTGFQDESLSWHNTCYLGEWSWLHEVHVKGPDSIKLFSDICVNSMARFAIGQAKHCIMCNEDGYIIIDGVLMRMGEEEFIAIANPHIRYVMYMAKKGNYNVKTEIIDWTNFQIAGPKAYNVVKKLICEDLGSLKFMHFVKSQINGIDVNVLRLSMAGSIGFEIQSDAEYHDELYNYIFEVGKEFGMRRKGDRVGARIPEVESGIPTTGYSYLNAIYREDRAEYLAYLKSFYNPYRTLYGSLDVNDVSEMYKTPVDMGWANRIKFDHEFIGRKALEKAVANPTKKMVTLVWNPEDVVDIYASLFREGGDSYEFMEIPHSYTIGFDQVLKDGKLIGDSGDRAYSTYYKNMLSQGNLNVEFSEPGTDVIIVWGRPGSRQKYVRATVAPHPYMNVTMRDNLENK